MTKVNLKCFWHTMYNHRHILFFYKWKGTNLWVHQLGSVFWKSSAYPLPLFPQQPKPTRKRQKQPNISFWLCDLKKKRKKIKTTRVLFYEAVCLRGTTEFQIQFSRGYMSSDRRGVSGKMADLGAIFIPTFFFVSFRVGLWLWNALFSYITIVISRYDIRLKAFRDFK